MDHSLTYPPSTASAAPPVSGPVWRNRNFVLLWLGEGISVVGDHFSMVAMPWLVLQLTGDALAMGTVTVLQTIPRVVFMLIGGVVTDRFSPRAVMLASNLLRLVMIAALAGLVWTGAIQMWMVYAYALIFGVVGAFFYPAHSAMPPRLLSPAQLQAGNALLMSTSMLGMVAGPALAGGLIAAFEQSGASGLRGVAMAFAVDALTFVASLSALAGLRVPALARASTAAAPNVLADLLEGLRFVGRDATLQAVFGVAALGTLLTAGPIAIGLPVLAQTRFAEGAAAYGLLMSASALGMLLGTVLAGVLPQPRAARLGMTLVSVYAAQGLGVAALPWASATAPAAALALGVGVCNGYVMILFTSWFQRRTPAALLGRVMSLLNVAVLGLAPVSTAAAGALSGLGVTALLAGAGGLMTVAIFVMAFQPALRAMGDEPAAA